MIDAHCHLDDKAFNGILPEIIENAKKVGVNAIINSASSFGSNEKTLKIRDEYDNYVFACCGLDPVNCIKDGRKEEIADFIRKNLKKISAIGEIGLDYHWEQRKDEQKANFMFFIELAEELKKPIVVHSREAMTDTLETLKKCNVQVMLHCFSGDEADAVECIDREYLLSFNTNNCFLKDRKSLIKTVPVEYMLAETDSPYNHPERKKLNEPANVQSIIDLISKTKEVKFEEIEKVTDSNARKFFRI